MLFKLMSNFMLLKRLAQYKSINFGLHSFYFTQAEVTYSFWKSKLFLPWVVLRISCWSDRCWTTMRGVSFTQLVTSGIAVATRATTACRNGLRSWVSPLGFVRRALPFLSATKESWEESSGQSAAGGQEPPGEGTSRSLEESLGRFRRFNKSSPWSVRVVLKLWITPWPTRLGLH